MRPLDFPPSIPNVLRHAAQSFPNNDFIVTADRSLTFAAAELESRGVAKRLLRDGVAKGTAVGLLFPQGAEFVVAFLAVTRIGAVAVPLSTFLRGPELRRAIRLADIDALLAPRELLGRDLRGELAAIWPGLDTATAPNFLDDAPFLRRVWLTEPRAFADLPDDPAISDEMFAALEAEVTPADRMVMVQTSGTTSEPKAVVHTHAAQLGHAWQLTQLYGLTSDVRTFTNMPLFWVGGLTVVLLTHLHAGATVITIERTDSTDMLDVIEKTRPTRLVGWTLLERLRADPTFAARDLHWLPELYAPSPAPGSRHGSLGMSETSGPHTVSPSPLEELPAELHGSFGPPVAGLEHKIVDPDTGASLAPGVAGEICVRGASLMEGLHKRERRETFDADGWYHTGDRGYFRDGFLFFTGRLSEMIKTRGANVAPREVEVAIESLPGVQAAFVVGVPDETRGEVVACLVCPDEGYAIEPEWIRDQLAGVLSSFKIPRRILVLPFADAPWLASGKISKPRVAELFATGE